MDANYGREKKEVRRMSMLYTPEAYKEDYRDIYSGYRLMGMTHTDADRETRHGLHPRYDSRRMAEHYKITFCKMEEIRERCLHLECILLDYAEFCDGPIPKESISWVQKTRFIRSQDPKGYEEIYNKMIKLGMTEQQAEAVSMRLIDPTGREDQIEKIGVSEEEYENILGAALKIYHNARKKHRFKARSGERTWTPKECEIVLPVPPKGTGLLVGFTTDAECRYCGYAAGPVYLTLKGGRTKKIDDFIEVGWGYIDDEVACPKCVRKAKR